jgi:hypothetical protein
VVKVLSCGHVAPAAGARVCAHLTTDNGPACFRVLTGIKTHFDLQCPDCADAEAPELLDACVGCFDRAEELAHLGWRGSPEVLLRDRELGGAWTTRPCPKHYLGYYFGALLPSPSGRSLLTDGWAWHPVGIPLIIDCAAWLAGVGPRRPALRGRRSRAGGLGAGRRGPRRLRPGIPPHRPPRRRLRRAA